MSEAEIINEEPIETEPSVSSEDKFFGVTTEINTNPSKEIEVEIIDDVPVEDRKPKKAKTAESNVENDDVDSEIANYSQRAADRINQVKYEYHEQRRAANGTTRR